MTESSSPAKRLLPTDSSWPIVRPSAVFGGDGQRMKIGVVGSGKLGMTAVRLFVACGHRVAVSNTRGPNSMPELITTFHGQARASTTTDIGIGGDVIILALPFGRYRELPVEPFRRKIVVDATNYNPDRDGASAALDNDEVTSTELIAQHLERARIVKAFNTMPYQALGTKGRTDAAPEQRLALFFSGEDQDAKQTVASLIDQLGFAAIDTGSLSRGGRLQQPGSDMYQTSLHGHEAEAAVAAAQQTVPSNKHR